jgi:hypothetical protein
LLGILKTGKICVYSKERSQTQSNQRNKKHSKIEWKIKLLYTFQIWIFSKFGPLLNHFHLSKICNLQILQKDQNICYTSHYNIPTIKILAHFKEMVIVRKYLFLIRVTLFDERCRTILKDKHRRTISAKVVPEKKIFKWILTN